MNNDQVARNVERLVGKFLDSTKTTPEEKESILAARELVITVIQSLVTIATSLEQIEMDIRNNGR